MNILTKEDSSIFGSSRRSTWRIELNIPVLHPFARNWDFPKTETMTTFLSIFAKLKEIKFALKFMLPINHNLQLIYITNYKQLIHIYTAFKSCNFKNDWLL